MIHLLETRLVQTNEVRRCAYLYPAFCYIYGLAELPLALIEIGTSAGLQLLWDQYAYSYEGMPGRYGEGESELLLSSEPRGDVIPFLLENSPPVASRTGVDLHVNDLSDPEDLLWMKALIWPEHRERMANFEKTADLMQINAKDAENVNAKNAETVDYLKYAKSTKYAVELVEGDGIRILDSLAADTPSRSALCIFHTHVANQFSEEDKELLLACIRRIGQERDVFHLYNNMRDAKLHLDYVVDGVASSLTLAETDGHGRWFRWEGAP